MASALAEAISVYGTILRNPTPESGLCPRIEYAILRTAFPSTRAVSGVTCYWHPDYTAAGLGLTLREASPLAFRKKPLTPAGTPSVLARAADRLGNSLRLYAEASFSSPVLFETDQEEAIDNLDRAFDAILAGFHSLYDAMTAERLPLNWHAYGDTAACIMVRNARHHNAAGLFESWNSRMLKHGELGRMAGAAFLLVGYRLVAGEGLVSEYYVRWDDFRARLDMPRCDSRISDPSALAALLKREGHLNNRSTQREGCV